MNEEISHIAQWQELMARANNFALMLTFDATAFYLHKIERDGHPRKAFKGKQLGQYFTLADLRAGISDYIAGERLAGRIKV